MVYEKDSLRLYHELTEKGKELYYDLLEKEADLIIWKNEHPIKDKLNKIMDFFKKLTDNQEKGE